MGDLGCEGMADWFVAVILDLHLQNIFQQKIAPHILFQVHDLKQT
jgi:hypothetical protein